MCYRFARQVLEELEESTHHPIIRLLLDYRTLHKLLTGFVETLYHTAKGQWQRQQHELERCQGQGQQPQRGGAATGGAVKPGGPGPVPDVIRCAGPTLPSPPRSRCRPQPPTHALPFAPQPHLLLAPLPAHLAPRCLQAVWHLAAHQHRHRAPGHG